MRPESVRSDCWTTALGPKPLTTPLEEFVFRACFVIVVSGVESS